MSHLRTLKQSGIVVAVLALLLAGSETLSYGVGNLPPTPCPCTADGVCRPKRDSWGHYETRWRTWPGDPASQEPTQADGAAPSRDELRSLPPFETPLPEQEDLRGPAKDKASKAAKDAASDNAAGEGPEALVPGADAIPAFDPQGNRSEIPGEIPSMNDAPPALPASLRQAARLLNMPQQMSQQQAPPTMPAAAPQPIRQASWQRPVSIQLINPASAIVAEPGTGSLQQAIYYEASDIDTAE